jgi:hypothetical protein
MSGAMTIRAVVLAVLAVALGSIASPADADQAVLEMFVGRWDVRVRTLQPSRPDVTYVETYEWVLGRKFLSGRTEQKSDGSEDRIVIGYDPQTKGYPLWIFSSTGTYLYLAPGSWDPRTRTMEWKNPPGWDISYRAQCVFPDRNSRRCTLTMKNWRGNVVLEQETTVVRRTD